MKKTYYLALIALVGITLSSCSLVNGDKDPVFKFSDLQGYWLQDNDPTEHYVRFTDQTSDEAGFFYGYEWHQYYGDEDQATYESDVLNDSLGNGWFKYKFESNGDLMEIHLMSIGSTEIPKFYYRVFSLTETNLKYYDKQYPNIKLSFTKVVVKK